MKTRNDYEYHDNGYRVITMPEWTKSLNNKAIMSSSEVAKIIGSHSGGNVTRMVSHGTFPKWDSSTSRRSGASHPGNPTQKGWSLKLLRSLEKRS